MVRHIFRTSPAVLVAPTWVLTLVSTSSLLSLLWTTACYKTIILREGGREGEREGEGGSKEREEVKRVRERERGKEREGRKRWRGRGRGRGISMNLPL